MLWVMPAPATAVAPCWVRARVRSRCSAASVKCRFCFMRRLTSRVVKRVGRMGSLRVTCSHESPSSSTSQSSLARCRPRTHTPSRWSLCRGREQSSVSMLSLSSAALPDARLWRVWSKSAITSSWRVSQTFSTSWEYWGMSLTLISFICSTVMNAENTLALVFSMSCWSACSTPSRISVKGPRISSTEPNSLFHCRRRIRSRVHIMEPRRRQVTEAGTRSNALVPSSTSRKSRRRTAESVRCIISA